MKDAYAISNDDKSFSGALNNMLLAFLPITYRKQVIEKFHDDHRGINAWKNLVYNFARWLLWIPHLSNS